jgi:hypothetical protein
MSCNAKDIVKLGALLSIKTYFITDKFCTELHEYHKMITNQPVAYLPITQVAKDYCKQQINAFSLNSAMHSVNTKNREPSE